MSLYKKRKRRELLATYDKSKLINYEKYIDEDASDDDSEDEDEEYDNKNDHSDDGDGDGGQKKNGQKGKAADNKRRQAKLKSSKKGKPNENGGDSDPDAEADNSSSDDYIQKQFDKVHQKVQKRIKSKDGTNSVSENTSYKLGENSPGTYRSAKRQQLMKSQFVIKPNE